MTLLQTDFLPNKPETFQALRYMMQDAGLQTGRVNPGDYKVTQHSTPNMTVDVAAGSAWIIGSSITRQGIYHQVNDGLVTVGNFANSDATNPRIDQVILVVNDSSAGGSSDTPQFAIVQGTPTAGATLDNRSGAVPDATINTTYRSSWVRWADVIIPAGSASVINANIRDRGPWARGFRGQVIDTGGQSTIGTSWTNVNTGTLLLRGEFSGKALKWRLSMNANVSFTGQGPQGFVLVIAPFMDGGQYGRTVARAIDNLSTFHDWSGELDGPLAGSHVFTIQADYSQSGFSALVSNGRLTIEEDLRTYGSN